MKQSTAIDIALACMDKEAQRLYPSYQLWIRNMGNEDKGHEYMNIREAMKIIKQLGQQGRIEL